MGAAASLVFGGKDQYFTPAQPVTPRYDESEGESPRGFQYTPAINLQYTPRAGHAGMSFDQLTALSQYDLIRIIIERLKEAMKAHDWDLACREGHDKEHSEQEIQDLKDFLHKPDKRDDWATWLSKILEDLLKWDAPAIYVHKDRKGDVWGLEVISGKTIKPLIDYRGFKPVGVDDQGNPLPAYQQVLYGTPYVNLSADDLIYAPRNRMSDTLYGFGPVEQVAITINMGFRRLLKNISVFTDGSMPDAWGELPEGWGLKEIQNWSDYWEALLAGDPQNRSKVRWLPGGGKITKVRDESVYGLHNEFDEWMARISCYAFGVSPQAFIKMVNKATAQEMGDIEAEYGLQTLKVWVKSVIDHIVQNVLRRPHLELMWLTDRGRLQAKRVDRNVKYSQTGIRQLDEIRQDEGEDPLGLLPGIITTSGYTPFTKDCYLKDSPWASLAPDKPDPAAMAKPGKMISGEPQSDDDESDVKAAAWGAELDQMERFAIKRIEKGKPIEGFKARFIEPGEVQAIEGLLKGSKTKDHVRHVFAERRLGVKALRIAPPSPDEASRKAVQISSALKEILVPHAAKIPVASKSAVLEDRIMERSAPVLAGGLAEILRRRREKA